MKALIIDEPWISYILTGEKTWEMRSTKTKMRGLIALIKKGSGQIVGYTNVVDSLGPLTLDILQANVDKHHIPLAMLPDVSKWCHAWVLERTSVLTNPIDYKHPQGAVIWVNV